MRTKIIFMLVLLLMLGRVNATLPVTDGLVMHLDADSLGLADGASVATWADLSTTGNDAIQAAANAQPTYISSSADYNGYACVQFDGTDDWMDMVESAVDIGNFTIFVVGKFDRPDGANMYFMSAQNGTGNDRLRIASYNGNIQSRVGNVGDFTLISGRDTDMHVYALTSVPDAWVDNGDLIDGGTNTFTGSPDSNGFVLGCYGTGSKDFLQGSIAEFVLYDYVLAEQDIVDTSEYLRLKYKPTQAANNPSPTGNAVDVDAMLSWDAPEAYTGATYDVYFGTSEPNFLIPAPYGLSNTLATSSLLTTASPVPSPMANDTTYYWVVDTYEPNDVPILHPGDAWSFTTLPSDNVPEVTAGSDWITWLDNGAVIQAVSGIVDDYAEGDVADADIVWSIQAYPGGAPATAMQMIDRGGDDALPDGETDDALLRDWIGTDTRGDNAAGDPLTLTIGGLASGTYTLTTIHHDLQDQTGSFDIAVDGTTVATGIDITSGTESPITRHVETVISDGLNPIEIVFDLNEGVVDPNAFFVMNGLEIEDAYSNVVKIDFSNNVATVSDDYDGYIATHENPDTFGLAYYGLGSGYVSIKPTWGQESAFASVTKTNTGLASTADLTTTVAGTYTLRLTAADDTTGGHPIPQVDWDILKIQVVEDGCAAAQLDTENWTGFMNGDINEDCKVNIEDLADLAIEWLLTNQATGSIEL